MTVYIVLEMERQSGDIVSSIIRRVFLSKDEAIRYVDQKNLWCVQLHVSSTIWYDFEQWEVDE